MPLPSTDDLARLADRYPDKLVPLDRIFGHVRGDRLFVGTGCGEPQHLVQALVEYARRDSYALVEKARTLDLVYEDGLTANVAFAVRDRFQNQGVGTELLCHLTLIARKQGLHGFTAEVLKEIEPMLRVFEKMRFPMESRLRDDVYELVISLK